MCSARRHPQPAIQHSAQMSLARPRAAGDFPQSDRREVRRGPQRRGRTDGFHAGYAPVGYYRKCVDQCHVPSLDGGINASSTHSDERAESTRERSGCCGRLMRVIRLDIPRAFTEIAILKQSMVSLSTQPLTHRLSQAVRTSVTPQAFASWSGLTAAGILDLASAISNLASDISVLAEGAQHPNAKRLIPG
jgi:hypothetical protein